MILVRIEEIVSKSASPLIIVIQGDHGPASMDQPDVSVDVKARERHSILNAYLLPAGSSALLYPSISPVNTFRVILNSQLGTDLAMLEDRSFYSQFDTPYDFTEATLDTSISTTGTKLTRMTESLEGLPAR
jgi:hypothetical protein